MRVILAEKPDMGRNIAEALGIASKDRHYITLKSGDVVTWAIGHLIQQKQPHSYPQYKDWKLENLPFVPYPVEMEVDPAKKDQLAVIKRLLSQSDTCVIATDPGREGEHIARTILEYVDYRGKLLRLWVHDLTPETIRTGFQQLRPAQEYDALAAAAKVRAAADFWMGITATRLFSIMAKEVAKESVTLSAGRVQTPTLRLVYDREMDIEQFEPKAFYTLKARFNVPNGQYDGQWFTEGPEGTTSRFDSKAAAEQIMSKIRGQQGQITLYSSKEVKRAAPMLFDGTALRAAARKELGFGIKKTTDLLQKVYDKKYCTYPRTSSRHLSENAADQLADRLHELREKSKYQDLFPDHIQSLKGQRRFVDNSKATEHHAVVPTGRNPEDFKHDDTYQLTTDEEKLYELILRHTLAAFHPEGVDQETEVVTQVEGELFQSKSVSVIAPGWRQIYKPQEEDPDESDGKQPAIPLVTEGQTSKVVQTDLNTGKTTKPKRFSDTDLENLMKYAGRAIDEEMAADVVLQQLKEKGIGTPATRVQIIEKLIKDEYIESKKNLIYLTDKGRNFMGMVYEQPLASIELTGEFEHKLEEVAAGARDAGELMHEFKQFAFEILNYKDRLQLIMEQRLSGKPLFDNVNEIGICPSCGKPVIEQVKSYSCTGWKDGCTFSIWKSFRKVDLKLKQVKDLLAGKEVLISNIPAAEGKRSYDMLLKLKDGKIDGRFPDAEDRSLGSCPICSKPVVEHEKTYSCSGRSAGCSFVVYKEFRKIQLPAKTIRSVLTGKEVLLKELPKANGEGAYDLFVFLKNGKLESRFPTAADSAVGVCPLCKHPVVETEYAYGCSQWKTGCKFKLSKEFLGQRIPVAQIKKLLKVGKTDKIDGFTGKNGAFATALGYDPEKNRYSFVK
ncbi:DNA topoisomerase [Priestia sp. BR_2]